MRRLFLLLLGSIFLLGAITPVTEQLTVATTVVGFSANKIQGAKTAFCRLETAEIRYEFGGSFPTTTVGFLWEVGEEKTLANTTEIPNMLSTFLAIRTGATSGQLDCKYY